MQEKIFEIPLRDLVIAQKGYKPLHLKNKPFEGSVPYLDVDSLENENFSKFTQKELANISTDNDVLVIWDGGRSGYTFKGKYGAIGSTLVCLNPICLTQNYLYYFLKSKFLYINGNAASTGVSHVSSDIIFNLNVPYISIEGQNEAVKSLENRYENYSKIHTQQKESIQQQLLETEIEYNYSNDSIEDSIINFRQTVLNKVFTGKFSNVDNFSNWQEFSLSEVGEIVAGQSVSSYEVNNNEIGLPYITGPEQLREGIFDKWTEHGTRKITKDSVFIIVKGTSVGTVFRGLKDVYIGRDLYAFVPDKKIVNANYIFHLLQYLTKELIDQSKGVIPGLTKNDIMNRVVMLPTIKEQEKIVNKIEELFKISDELYIGYKESTHDIIQLEKSVLQNFFDNLLSKKEESEELIDIARSKIFAERNIILSKFEEDKKENIKMKQKILAKKKSEVKPSIQEQIQASAGSITAKEIWENSVYDGDIDSFYEEAKRCWEAGVIDWHLEKINEITPDSVITLKNK